MNAIGGPNCLLVVPLQAIIKLNVLFPDTLRISSTVASLTKIIQRFADWYLRLTVFKNMDAVYDTLLDIGWKLTCLFGSADFNAEIGTSLVFGHSMGLLKHALLQ